MPAKHLTPIPELPLPPQEPPKSGWGRRIENAGERLGVRIHNALATGIRSILAWAIQDFVEAFEAGAIEVYGDLADTLIADPEAPEELKALLSKIFSGQSQGAAAALASFGASAGTNIAGNLLTPLFNLTRYLAEGRVHSARFDPVTWFQASRRMPETFDKWKNDLFDMGWDEKRIAAFGALTTQRVGESDLLTLWLRGKLPDEELNAELFKRGWPTLTIPDLKELRQVIPNVTDLIRMAVREAFNDEIAAKFEYDADYPAEVDEWAAKQGLAPEWSKRYWRSHWELPSVQAGFEMVHRLRPGTTDNPFTVEDLSTLLRTADIPRFFRERLIEVSYNPYTRVDIRRMFKLGILDRDGVKSAYLDGGYDEEHAENLTKFTVMDVSSDERDLTRGAVITGYKRALITRDDAKTQLTGFGYDDNETEFWLSLADWEIQAAALDEAVGRVKFLYTNGEIEMGQVYAELGPYNLPAIQVQNYLKQWDVIRRNKVALPSEADLFDFYDLNIIDLGLLQTNLKNKGYTPERIDWLTRRNDLKQAEKAGKEAALAQAEQERIAKAEAASAYQKAAATIDVDIAQYKVSIADKKLAMHDLEKGAPQEAVKKEIAEIQVFIAELQQSKAELKVTPPTTAA